MVDDAKATPEFPDEGIEISGPPAPLGRTVLLIGLALAASTAICCLLRRDELPPETGTIKGRSTPMISDWSGRIERFLVKPGDAVNEGDPIAILVDEHLILEIDRLKREVADIQSALKQAERSADELLTQKLLMLDTEIVNLRSQPQGFALPPASAERIDALESERINAAHNVRESLGIGRIRRELVRATAARQFLQSRSLTITVPAPVTGSVRRLLRQPGERIVRGTPFLELADQNQPYLIVELPEPTAKRFALGDTIPLKFPGSRRSIGRVANMERIRRAEEEVAAAEEDSKQEPRVRMEIEPRDDDWPEIPLKTPVRVRTSHSDALSRRVH